MSQSSKSPLAVARAAYATGQSALPKYAHKFSRHDFTCAQLFAVLVLRKFFKTDYRGVIAYLAEWAELRQALELHKKLPHFTTPQKAGVKLLDDALVRKLLTQTLAQFHRLPPIDDDDVAYVMRIDQAAIDSTGFESHHCSHYFTHRRKQGENKDEPVGYHRFGKLGLIVDCANHLILSILPGRGPKPDVDELEPLMKALAPNVWPDQLLADAGYDSEANHQLLRERCSVESVIPPKHGRPGKDPDHLPAGKWRWLMATNFNEDDYGQRWQVETVMFMLKAHQGDALTARRPTTQRGELNLIALTHNLLILLHALIQRAFLQGMSE
jgi:hypothetical protein